MASLATLDTAFMYTDLQNHKIYTPETNGFIKISTFFYKLFARP